MIRKLGFSIYFAKQSLAKSKTFSLQPKHLNNYKRYPFFLISIFLLFVVVQPNHAETRGKGKTETLKKEQALSDIKKKISKKRVAIKKVKKDEITVLTELERIDKAIVKAGQELQKIERNLKVIGKQMHKTEKNISLLTKRGKQLSSLLDKRLVAIYKMREGGIMRVLFSSSSPGEIEKRYKYMTAIVNSDVNLMDSYKDNITALQIELTALKMLQSDRIALKKTKKSRIAKQKGGKREKHALLMDVRVRKKTHLRALDELEGAADRLQSLISDLKNKTRFKGVGFASKRGKLPMPVKGDVVSFYGKVKHPKFRTVTFNNGIFIKAASGSEIRSVYGGKVIYKGWLRGYGQVIIIDHGADFYTLFAHLLKISRKVGSEVHAGDVVALVGDTGSLRGTGLYFEVRKKGAPQDPLTWIAHK